LRKIFKGENSNKKEKALTALECVREEKISQIRLDFEKNRPQINSNSARNTPFNQTYSHKSPTLNEFFTSRQTNTQVSEFKIYNSDRHI